MINIIQKLSEKCSIVYYSAKLVSMYVSFFRGKYDKALMKATNICLNGVQVNAWSLEEFYDKILCGATEEISRAGKGFEWRLHMIEKFAIEMGL